MTPSEIQRLVFSAESVKAWSLLDQRNINWPVVYVLDDVEVGGPSTRVNDVYVGESRNAAGRMRQHLDSSEKRHLRTVRVIIDPTFNKSVCLDLESYLIRMLAGDGSYRVLNRNDGIVESNYFKRADYHATFLDVFEALRADGVFTRSVPEIENSALFKLSPYKALTVDQAVAVEGILESLFEDFTSASSMSVVHGEPGTGKTVIAIYLVKLLVDIQSGGAVDDRESDTMFSEFFTGEYEEMLRSARIGLVVPQQSLRESIRKVFRKTPGLDPMMVMTAFDVGESPERFDLLIVDESHRLNQRANQPSGVQNKKFQEITTRLFGADDTSKTQLDWIRAQSSHQIFLVDSAQSVRPADLALESLDALVMEATAAHRLHRLASQMRVQAGADYVSYIRGVFGEKPPEPLAFEGYELRMFDTIGEMSAEIRRKDSAEGLSRLLAGFAWPWKSKRNPAEFDIVIDGFPLRWNSTLVDWVASPKSLDEVGSIHTIQGYDLNYAGVIIGPDLRFDPVEKRIVFDRSSYFDAKGKENNRVSGRIFTDDDLLRYVRNVYAVLLTRGIRGTYLYVCDPHLREYLRQFVLART